MDALVKQLSSSRALRIGAPLPIVTGTATVAIAGPNEFDRPDITFLECLSHPGDGRMEAVIVAGT